MYLFQLSFLLQLKPKFFGYLRTQGMEHGKELVQFPATQALACLQDALYDYFGSDEVGHVATLLMLFVFWPEEHQSLAVAFLDSHFLEVCKDDSKNDDEKSTSGGSTASGPILPDPYEVLEVIHTLWTTYYDLYVWARERAREKKNKRVIQQRAIVFFPSFFLRP